MLALDLEIRLVTHFFNPYAEMIFFPLIGVINWDVYIKEVTNFSPLCLKPRSRLPQQVSNSFKGVIVKNNYVNVSFVLLANVSC